VGVLTKLRIADPVPFVLNAPTLPDQSQQCFWGRADAGDEQVADAGGALAGGLGRVQLHDPGTSRPALLDVIGRFLGPELPARITPVTFLLSRCGERDLALSLELATDLPTERGLVRFDGQGDVGALLEAPAKKLAWCAARRPGSVSPLDPSC